jgi:tryptophanyl-tRNA synthetase
VKEHSQNEALTESVNDRFRPIRARRLELLRDPAYLRHVLHEGNARARAVAEETLEEVRELMYTVY